VFDAERMNEPAASKLLKTLEEPPPTAVLVLVTAGADQLLPTIRSRCQRVDFAFLGADAVTASLAANGVAPERAALLARLAGGRLDRARAIDGRLGVVRDAFVETAETIDGSGASVALRAEAVQSALHEALADLEAAQAVETERLAAEFTAAGYPERTQRAQLRRLEDRHKRQHRYARTEAMIEGITALETMYRDALVGADTEQLNADRPRLVIDPRGAVAAIEACRAARHALVEHNPAEQLLLERLFLHLAPSGHVTPSLRGR
jgi:DNA polymerase-3 subunit delta'